MKPIFNLPGFIWYYVEEDIETCLLPYKLSTLLICSVLDIILSQIHFKIL